MKDAYDMRIILTHEYFRIDAAIVWTTVCENLPLLKAQLVEFSADDHAAPDTGNP
ncbi:MAG: HepT-like ribonuclease domain-containing protein [Rhodocyclaceae bacterium]